MRIGTVAELWRYPVKSMGGEALRGPTPAARTGLEGDRRMAVVDLETGKVLSAKTVPLLLQASAALEGDTIRMTSDAGGLDVTAADADVDERLSAWLGRPVHLATPVPGARAVFDLELDPDDPSEVAELRTPPGSFFDSRSTLHLLSTTSLRGQDARRFRPNLLVDVDGDEAFPEDAWVGRELHVGGSTGVTVSVRKTTPRCVLVSKPQPGLAHDSAVFRELVREREGNLGVYIDAADEGVVSVGDPVELR